MIVASRQSHLEASSTMPGRLPSHFVSGWATKLCQPFKVTELIFQPPQPPTFLYFLHSITLHAEAFVVRCTRFLTVSPLHRCPGHILHLHKYINNHIYRRTSPPSNCPLFGLDC
jgi:hypothetical protein